MKELWLSNFESVMYYFDLYFDSSSYFALFLMALVICFILIKKDNKKERVLLIWVPILVSLIIINPIVFKHLNKLIGEDMGNTYWRVFWLIPLAPVMGVAFTKLVELKDGKFAKILVVFALIGIIAYSGKFVYNSDNFQKVANWYKIPDTILDIVLASRDVELENKKVMCPLNVIAWVRQVDSSMVIEYGRPVNNPHKLLSNYSKGEIAKYMKKFMNDKCNILIIEKGFEIDVNVEDYGYVLFHENDQFLGYMNENLK